MSSTIDYCSDDGEADALYSSKIKLAEAKKEIAKLNAENARLREAIDLLRPKIAAIPGCSGVGRIMRLSDWQSGRIEE